MLKEQFLVKVSRLLALVAVCLLMVFPQSLMGVPQIRMYGFNVVEGIVVADEHYIDVPFYYQVKTYYCGPAALQMVFDFYGEKVSQFEIADVARTVPYVTYTDELRRATHFSNMSTSMGDEMPENITGYTARKLGYAAFEMGGMTLDDLKSLIDQDFPIILLMRWVPGEEYGHYRVAVGYNETHVFLHDPWNNIEWGGEYGGPNLAMNYTFFDEMWNYSGHWGLRVSPWKISLIMLTTVYVGQLFLVSPNITYVCPGPFPPYDYSASSCTATITLPEGLTLAEGKNATKNIGSLQAGGTAQVFWIVEAERPGNYCITIDAEGEINGFVGEKADVGQSYNYQDRIGAYARVLVTAKAASQIYISGIDPTQGPPGSDVELFGGGATPKGAVSAWFIKPSDTSNLSIGIFLGRTVANDAGEWEIIFTVPSVSPGNYTILAEDNETKINDTIEFGVLAVGYQIRISYISTSSGPPGTMVYLSGDGASSCGEVRVYFDGMSVTNATAKEGGWWSTSFQVPDVELGNYTIKALDVVSNSMDMAMFTVVPARNVGIKVGDWAKYDVTLNYSTNDPSPPISPPPTEVVDIEYFLLTVVSVTGTNVTFETTIHLRNGTEVSSVSWLDVSSGQTYYGMTMPTGPLIAANLTAGDKVYLNPYSPTINSTVMGVYAGLEREVNCLMQMVNTSGPRGYWMVGEMKICWDRTSGILDEQSMDMWYIEIAEGYRTHTSLRMVITETNIWTRPTGVSVNVNVYPKLLNLRSKGKWVICRVELARGFRAKDVDVSTLMLNGTVLGEVVHGARGARYLIVKFDREAVIDLIMSTTGSINKFGTVSLTVTGKFKDDTSFTGTVILRIVMPTTKNIGRHVLPI